MRSKSITPTEPDEPRDRHGDRGLPAPAEFDFDALPDGALLTEREVASLLRVARITLASWRQQSDHPLRWLALPNGFIRYKTLHVRQFLGLGAPRKRKPKPSGTPAANTEISHGAAPARRRVRRARAEELPAQEQA